MSTIRIEQITALSVARAAQVRTEEDSMAVLRDHMVALAQQSADHLYLKVSTEPGWTSESASHLADKVIEGHCLAIADSVHAFGGTVEMACELSEESATAFGKRLRDLSAAPKIGGVA